MQLQCIAVLQQILLYLIIPLNATWGYMTLNVSNGTLNSVKMLTKRLQFNIFITLILFVHLEPNKLPLLIKKSLTIYRRRWGGGGGGGVACWGQMLAAACLLIRQATRQTGTRHNHTQQQKIRVTAICNFCRKF